jgi:hypothetical protein
MKLIELLARELKEWPSDCSSGYCVQSDDDGEVFFGDPAKSVWLSANADDSETARVTREEWAAARLTTPTLETMLAEWRDLEARAQVAQAEADALFEHAGQCHGEIVVRLAELGWGAPRAPMVPGEPVVTLDTIEPWVIDGYTAPDDATHYGGETSMYNAGFYKQVGDGWEFWSTFADTFWRPITGDDTSRFISRPSTQP